MMHEYLCRICLHVIDRPRHNCRVRKCVECFAHPHYPHDEECPRLAAALSREEAAP